MTDSLGVILLTFNSRNVIERTVQAALQVSQTVICVDSGSTGGTPALLQQLGCEVHDRPFKHYADQRNWTIENLGNRYAWQLHLDAEEILDALAITEIKAAVLDPGGHAGSPAAAAHLIPGARVTPRGHDLLAHAAVPVGQRCRRRSALRPTFHLPRRHKEAARPATRHERGQPLGMDRPPQSMERPGTPRAAPRLGRDIRSARGAPVNQPTPKGPGYRGWYYRAPPFLRAWAFFGLRYFVQLGFLDGAAGFPYAFFQPLWFRMLIDAKLSEAAAADERRA